MRTCEPAKPPDAGRGAPGWGVPGGARDVLPKRVGHCPAIHKTPHDEKTEAWRDHPWHISLVDRGTEL